MTSVYYILVELVKHVQQKNKKNETRGWNYYGIIAAVTSSSGRRVIAGVYISSLKIDFGV